MTDQTMLYPLNRTLAAVLIIDMQQKLLPTVQDSEGCVAAAMRLIEAAAVLKLPVLAAEQYPAGLGHTDPRVAALLNPSHTFEKKKFSAWIEPMVSQLGFLSRNQIIVAGIETHVCVQLTVLDLLREGNQVWVCADAVSSRRGVDREIALSRMSLAGAVVTTTESVIFELLGEAGSDEFKRILKIVK